MVRITIAAAVLVCLELGACGDDSERTGASAADTAMAPDQSGGATHADAASGDTSTSAADTTPVSFDTTSGATSAYDAGTTPDAGPADTAGGNTNITFGGAQDFGYVRSLVASGQVPRPTDLDPAGFYAEHSTPLPDPVCGQRLCVQAMLAAMRNLLNGQSCTMLQLGLNSPIVADQMAAPPLTLAVVIDTSGSMNDAQKIDYVRAGLERLVSQLADVDRIAIITYDTETHVRQPMVDVQGHRNQLIDLVRGLVANGATNLYAGLASGYHEVAQNYDSGRQNRVILLSDGNPTVGTMDPAAILSMSAGFNSDGIGLTTIGLGTDFNRPLMQGLAEQGDGNSYFLENGTAVDEVFTEELAYFTVPVGFDVSLSVRPGPFYDVDRISGSKRMTIGPDGVAELDLPSVFFAHRTSDSDVFHGSDGVGRRGGGSLLLLEMAPTTWDGEPPPETDVAEVRLSFREPGTDETKQESVVVHYPHPPGDMLEEGYFDGPIVTKSFVVMNEYSAIETACLLFWGGEAREGRDVLAQVIAAAADYEDSANDGTGDVDIAADIDLMTDLLHVIENVAGLNQPPPPPPADPWPHD